MLAQQVEEGRRVVQIPSWEEGSDLMGDVQKENLAKDGDRLSDEDTVPITVVSSDTWKVVGWISATSEKGKARVLAARFSP